MLYNIAGLLLCCMLLLTQKIPLNMEDKTLITEQVTQALAYMHNLQPPMIHRDVKQPNVLVSSQLFYLMSDNHYITLQIEKGTLHVYLTDMGMEKIKVGCATMTQVQLVGTSYYAAPETYEGNVRKPSGVWSLGMVLLELYSGKHAWGEIQHHNQLLKLILIKQFPKIDHLEQVQQKICKACLSCDPKTRKSVHKVLLLLRTK